MPELPEAETLTRDLRDKVAGRIIERVQVKDPRVIYRVKPAAFKKALTGKTITRVDRRGKALIFYFSPGGYLVVQLRMTGFWTVTSRKVRSETASAVKVIFQLNDGLVLNYNDLRTLGWLMYAEDLSKISFLVRLGPEPLSRDFSVDYIQAATFGRKVPVKTLLMDQAFAAGIGNIYASEILFEAGIHPARKALDLSERDCRRIKESTARILKKAIRMRGSSLRDYRDTGGEKGRFTSAIRVYNREAQPCPVCGTAIERSVQSARSTYHCPSCQT